MGRLSVQFEATNNEDLVQVKIGTLAPDEVRRVHLSGVVDTGATRLVLPAHAVQALGVPESGDVAVRYADGRQQRRVVVEQVRIEIMGRSSTFTAVVEPGRTDALIGAIVLEELDFIVDCTGQKLVPRDPRGILTEIE